MERELELTRGCIKVLGESGLGLQVVTKSDLASRDADLLEGMSSAVAITVTTLDEPLARRLEPGAPRPGRRLEAIRALSRRGVPVSARLDPIIPGINDSDLDQLVSAVAEAGARHVTTSTFKAGPGSLRLLREEFPEEAGHLGKLFERGRRVGRSIYLPKEVRAGILDEVRRGCRERGLSFSACREGLYPPDGSCDGSHLISGPGKRGRSQVQSRGFR
jgi:DNA repair photolyase